MICKERRENESYKIINSREAIKGQKTKEKERAEQQTENHNKYDRYEFKYINNHFKHQWCKQIN